MSSYSRANWPRAGRRATCNTPPPISNGGRSTTSSGSGVRRATRTGSSAVSRATRSRPRSCGPLSAAAAANGCFPPSSKSDPPTKTEGSLREIGRCEESAATVRSNFYCIFGENSHSAARDSWVSPELGLVEDRVLGVDLPRLVIIARLAAALPAVLSLQTADPAAALVIEAQPAEFLVAPPSPLGPETRTAHPRSLDPAAAAAIDSAPGADPTAGWFDDRALKLSAAGDDKSDMFVDPAACVYPDALLRSLAGGQDDCGLLKPGADESEILTLPFLALSAWVGVICAIAALHYFHRNWRLWRWLRSMRA